MSVLTETSLRAELRNKKINQYFVTQDVKITPSAKQFLKENRIELVIREKEEITNKESKAESEDKNRIFPKYYEAFTGGFFEDKPEFMTQLYGNKLVIKDHPRIIMRGKLDSLQSRIMEVQIVVSAKKNDALMKDLEEVLRLCRNIMRAEVLNEALEDIMLMGFDEKKLREISHNPQKYFNTSHILPSWEMGEIAVHLNSIRSMVREVELSTVRAFKTEEGVERIDIIKALNRMSSCIYIIMLRQITGYYNGERRC